MATGIFSGTLLGLISGVPVDVKLSEKHEMTATPADYALEDGSNVSDHVVLNPVELEIDYKINSIDAPGLSYGIKSAVLYNILREKLKSRALLTLVTRHVLYRNMVCVGLPAQHTAPERGTLTGTAKFRQINLPNIQSVTVPTSQLKQDGTQFKAGTTVPNATQLLQNVDTSPNLLDPLLETFGG